MSPQEIFTKPTSTVELSSQKNNMKLKAISKGLYPLGRILQIESNHPYVSIKGGKHII